MTEETGTSGPKQGTGNPRLALLLAMAMFVLVVDTSLMNVSISAVVEDLDTTVSGVQSAIALEALVSAAFILIGSKVGDLIGRKRAYVLGLLGYAIGALAMTLAQSLTAIIIFWAIIGGLGASLLLPAMQSLIHGNFEGAAQKKVYALVGAAAAIAAAVGPLLGGFITTYLSWRVGFLLEVVDHRGRAVRHQARPRRALHRAAEHRRRSARSSPSSAWAASCWASWCGRRAARPSARSSWSARSRWPRWSTGCVRRKREGKPTLLDPDLFRSKLFRLGITEQMLQQIALGGTMIALPIYLQMVLEYNAMQAGLSLAPLSLSMFAVALLAGQEGRASGARAASSGSGFALLDRRDGGADPDRAPGRLRLVPRGPAGHRRIRAGPAGVPAQQLHAGADLGGAGQRGRRRELGRRVVRAVVRPGVRRRHHAGGARPSPSPSMAEVSTCSPRPSSSRSPQVLEDDAEVMSNTQLEELLAGQPEDDPGRDHPHQHRRAAASPCRSRCSSRSSPASLGLLNSFRMMRLPDPDAVRRPPKGWSWADPADQPGRNAPAFTSGGPRPTVARSRPRRGWSVRTPARARAARPSAR